MILRALLRGVVWQGLLSLLGHVPASPLPGIRPGALALVLFRVLRFTPPRGRRSA
jgi:hypothetical protein